MKEELIDYVKALTNLYGVVSKEKLIEIYEQARDKASCPLQKVHPSIKITLIHKLIIKNSGKKQENVKGRFEKLELY